ncbi:transmembrane protein 238 [Brachyhypopomus gauderio]|uniref:transmembrane protein 238 n=1 Tax=Brachyhypopomus gauderio TaxID=698409 RepID=UPI0040429CD1
MEEVFGGLGRCSCAFWLAVAFDVFGLIILLVGVFADLFFYDFLIYAGAIIIFLSLIWWVFWYTGNIAVPPEDLEDDVGLLKKDRGFVGVLRRMSSRLSNGIRNSIRRNGTTRGHGTMPGPSAYRRGGGRQVPVTLPMSPQEDLNTVSATVAGETRVSDNRIAETSAI